MASGLTTQGYTRMWIVIGIAGVLSPLWDWGYTVLRNRDEFVWAYSLPAAWATFAASCVAGYLSASVMSRRNLKWLRFAFSFIIIALAVGAIPLVRSAIEFAAFGKLLATSTMVPIVGFISGRYLFAERASARTGRTQ